MTPNQPFCLCDTHFFTPRLAIPIDKDILIPCDILRITLSVSYKYRALIKKVSGTGASLVFRVNRNLVRKPFSFLLLSTWRRDATASLDIAPNWGYLNFNTMSQL